MKRKFAFLIAACIACASLSACSSSGKSSNSGSADNNTAVTESQGDDNNADDAAFEEMLDKYEPPGKIVEIDMDAEDPSNDDIKFTFDGEGKIQNYTYTVNGLKVLMTYDYDYPEEGKLWVLAFSEDGTVIDEKTFVYSKSDDAKGFSEHEGYYFKDIQVFESTF